jgi:UDP-glucose 4-epimerase
MATCLVTGGAGFIGSHLAEALVREGHRVRVLDNLSTGDLANLAAVRDDVEFVRGDLADLEAVRQATRGAEVVFHQAALPSVPRSVADPLGTHAACATGTLHALVAAREAGVRRLVYAASSSAYGNSDRPFKGEADLPRPLSPYAVAKLVGEHYCQAFGEVYGFEAVCLRYFNVFGPRQQPGGPYSAVIPLFMDAMLHGRRPLIYGDGTQSRDFTYIDNVVRANLLAATAPRAAGKVFNAACGRSVTLLDLVAGINALLGTAIEPEFAPPRAGDVKHSLADITAARADLGYEPLVGVEEGLRRCLAYYRGRRPGAAVPAAREAACSVSVAR